MGEEINVHSARKYMSDVAEPIITKLVQRLAVEQPSNVLEFMIKFAEEEMGKTHRDAATEDQSSKPLPVCSVTGSEAEMKTKDPETGQIVYYALDIFDALKRKHKLRGLLCARVDENFEDERPPEWLLSIDPNATGETNAWEDKPVTPPRRIGFDMTRPGENYHDGAGPRREPINVGPVKFEARALGIQSKEGEEISNLSQPKEVLAAAAQQRIAKLEAKENLTEEQRKELNLKRKKDAIVGRIHAHYASIGGVPPMGLAAASIESLQKHMQKLQITLDTTKNDREEVEVTKETNEKLSRFIGGNAMDAQQRAMQPQRVMDFEPRALGGSSSTKSLGNEVGGGAEETPEERRKRAAQAALTRLAK